MNRSQPGTRKQKITNPLVQGIEVYLSGKARSNDDISSNEDGLVAAAIRDTPQTTDVPKRYTIYEPMLLLPISFKTHTTAWRCFFQSLTESQRHQLFDGIVSSFAQTGRHITHVALNAPIEAQVLGEIAEGRDKNVMRAPANLEPLYGDFGPGTLLCGSEPAKLDFDTALWVSTSQLPNITQIWAPRWTMFSRGNIREKARILGHTQQNPSSFRGMTQEELGEPLSEADVIDMYVGIGYFAIPYLRRGTRRVIGWELNPWSVEGLRRGCEANGFKCRVFQVGSDCAKAEMQCLIDEVIAVLKQDKQARCLAFCGDNSYAADVLAGVEASLRGSDPELNIRHCNLGLLPTSTGSWAGAVDALSTIRGGWLHVHENAEILQVEQKRQEVMAGIVELTRRLKGSGWLVDCEYTEMVKTYAPGVGHFVFDIRLSVPIVRHSS